MQSHTPGRYPAADFRNKPVTARRVVACGELRAGRASRARLLAGRWPSAEALAMAETAGLQGAKQASLMLPLCAPLTLSFVDLRCLRVPEFELVRVYCEVAAEARTGVEIEAMAGVNAALLTLYDLTQSLDLGITLAHIRVLFKEGGRRGLSVHPDGMTPWEWQQYHPTLAPARAASHAPAAKHSGNTSVDSGDSRNVLRLPDEADITDLPGAILAFRDVYWSGNGDALTSRAPAESASVSSANIASPRAARPPANSLDGN